MTIDEPNPYEPAAAKSADDERLEAEIIRIGEEAITVLKQTFENWMKVARALDIGRRKALAETHANSIQDRGYQKAFGRWLDRHPKFNDKKVLPSSTRTWLFRCYDHESDILDWRKRRGFEEQLRYNFPEQVFKRWARDEAPELLEVEGRAPKDKSKPSPSAQRDAEIARLQEELDAAHGKIRRLERDDPDALLMSRKDTPEQWLDYLEAEVPTKTARLSALLLNRQKSTAPTRRAAAKKATPVKEGENV